MKLIFKEIVHCRLNFLGVSFGACKTDEKIISIADISASAIVFIIRVNRRNISPFYLKFVGSLHISILSGLADFSVHPVVYRVRFLPLTLCILGN